MGFFKKLFFGEDKEKTKEEKQLEENVKAGADYSHVVNEQEIFCTACGIKIDGRPRIKEHQGKTFFLHKRCFKAMMRGELPKTLPTNKDDQASTKDL
jgi:hypothetical protein